MLPFTAENGYIFRIVHVDNVAGVLEHGLCSRSSAPKDQSYRNIGNLDLISKRSSRVVPVQPNGTLSEYVPFYFTSRSPMLYNIKTGRNVSAIPMEEVVIFGTSVYKVAEAGIPVVITDRHAYLATARFSNSFDDLAWIDWDILQRSDFAYDVNDIGKMDRYQAEALVYERLPVNVIGGILTYSESQRNRIVALAETMGVNVNVTANPRYFF